MATTHTGSVNQPHPAAKPGPIAWFAGNPVAANLLMPFFIVGGIVSGTHLAIQYFSPVDLRTVTITMQWTGASAEDVEAAITDPIERELLGLDTVRKMTSKSTRGHAVITLEHEEGSDMAVALDQVKERVSSIRKRLVTAAIRHPWTTLSGAVAALLLTVGLVQGDRLTFNPGRIRPIAERLASASYSPITDG